MKKRIPIILMMILIVCMIAACSSGNTTTNSNANANKGTEPAAQTENTTEPEAQTEDTTEPEPAAPAANLSIMVQNHPAWPLKEDWLVWKVMGDLGHVNLKPLPIQGNWWETIPLIVASGDLPDILWTAGDLFQKYGQEGAFVNYLEHLDKMPNLANFMKQYPEEVKPLLSADGKLYVTPSHDAFDKLQSLFMYREDIFKKNNLQQPTNYDEFYALLKKLKELYPDSTPWVFFNQLSITTILGLNFDTDFGFYFNQSTNSYAYGPSEDNYKAMVEFLNKLYKEKLISTEFLTMDLKQRSDLISNDKAFIINGYINELDSFNQEIRKTNPDFKLAQFTPPVSPMGKQFHSRDLSFLGEGLSVSSKTKELDAALGLIDAMYSEQAKEALSWGVEGQTFTKADGKDQFDGAVANANDRRIKFGLQTPGTSFWVDNDSNLALMSPESKQAAEEGSKFVAPKSFTPAFTKEEQDVLSLNGQAIGKYAEENISKFIIGNRSLSEWNDYVEGYKKLGLDDVLKVYNEAKQRADSTQLGN
ncbi:extracellular solute-binding protein [Paenibacillus silvisoli]|uniref:extracellular solute-binding protein n=1 Tax=Paenibacillus silvisoli TaxID=3110539 RepID=UPI002803EBF4|nr:extracellular solute-binding protein [Paenibacillus silvisoli]